MSTKPKTGSTEKINSRNGSTKRTVPIPKVELRSVEIDGQTVSVLQETTESRIESARSRERLAVIDVLLVIELTLRKMAPLEPIEAVYLADTINFLLQSPRRIAQELGLIATPGRPKGRSLCQWTAGRKVQEFLAAGVPWADSSRWEGDQLVDIPGATTRVAVEMNITSDQAKRAYTYVNKVKGAIEKKISDSTQ